LFLISLDRERERERERDVVTQQQPSVSERSTAAVSVETVPGTDGFTRGCARGLLRFRCGYPWRGWRHVQGN